MKSPAEGRLPSPLYVRIAFPVFVIVSVLSLAQATYAGFHREVLLPVLALWSIYPHTLFGAWVMQSYFHPPRVTGLGLLRDFLLIVLFSTVPLVLNNPVLWVGGLAVFFLIVSRRYSSMLEVNGPSMRSYLLFKSRSERIAGAFLFVLAAMAYWASRKGVSTAGVEFAVIAGGLVFTVWTVFVKRLYTRENLQGLEKTTGPQ